MKNTTWIALPLLFRVLALSFAGVSVFAASGCVTVNVNIPDSDMQQASDDYVQELYDAKAKQPKPSPSPSLSPSPEVSPQARAQSEPRMTEFSMSLWIPSAQADDSASASTGGHVVSTKSPKLHELMERMRARLGQIIPLKKSGMLGESKTGKLLLHGKPTRSQWPGIRELLVDENHDRADLYQELLAHNKLPQSNLSTVERSFAQAFQKHSPPGTWIQDSAGQWSRKTE